MYKTFDQRHNFGPNWEERKVFREKNRPTGRKKEEKVQARVKI
jgi:hypothetical protein